MSKTTGRKNRLNRKLKLHSMAAIQQIRENLRESAISTKCALLEPSIRTYGSPRTRRKRDVEGDHAIALQCMSPYPVSKLDLLDDLEDIHTNVPFTTTSSTGAALETRARLDTAPSRAWGKTFRETETSRSNRYSRYETKEETHQHEQKAMDLEFSKQRHAPEQKKIEYSTYTQSLIERTHSRLYDEPKYISMTKRALGIKEDEKAEQVLADVSRIEQKRSMLHDANDTSFLGLSLRDLDHQDSYSTFGRRDYFDVESELPLLTADQREQSLERSNYSNYSTYSGDAIEGEYRQTALWTKGAPAVYAPGAIISTDGVYGRQDEPRVQIRDGDWLRLGMSRQSNKHHNVVNASTYRQRAQHLADDIRCNVAPSSPGVVYLHTRTTSVSDESERKNVWETVSRANALSFRDGLQSPMKRADSSARVMFLHQRNNNTLRMSIL